MCHFLSLLGKAASNPWSSLVRSKLFTSALLLLQEQMDYFFSFPPYFSSASRRLQPWFLLSQSWFLVNFWCFRQMTHCQITAFKRSACRSFTSLSTSLHHFAPIKRKRNIPEGGMGWEWGIGENREEKVSDSTTWCSLAIHLSHKASNWFCSSYEINKTLSLCPPSKLFQQRRENRTKPGSSGQSFTLILHSKRQLEKGIQNGNQAHCRHLKH